MSHIDNSSYQTVKDCADCDKNIVCFLRKNFRISMGIYQGVGYGIHYTPKYSDAVRWFDKFAQFCSFYDNNGSHATKKCSKCGNELGIVQYKGHLVERCVICHDS